jgi:hypothetical protein
LRRLARSFERDGLRTNALHGDKSQDERLKALDAFKAGSVDVLVAPTWQRAGSTSSTCRPSSTSTCRSTPRTTSIGSAHRTCRRIRPGCHARIARRRPMVSDIEKLIKKKIEIEPLELDDEPPPRRSASGGSRIATTIDRSEIRCGARGRPRRRRAVERSVLRQALRTDASDAEPAWERKTPAVPRGISPNIKPKRKVAALFGAKVPEEVES